MRQKQDAAIGLKTADPNGGYSLEELQKIKDSAKEGGIVEKTFANSPAAKIGDVAKGVSEFMMQGTGKVYGGLITKGIGAVEGAVGDVMGNKALSDKGTALQKEGEKGATVGNAVWSALELYPGGQLLTSEIRGLPQAEELGQKLLSSLKDVPGKEGFMSGVSKMLESVPKKMKAWAVKNYIEALAPTKEVMKREAMDVAPTAIEKGVKLSNKAEETAGMLGGKVTEVGKQIDALWETIPDTVRVKAAPVLEAIQKSAEKYAVAGKVVGKEALDLLGNVGSALAGLGERAKPFVQEFKDISSRFVEGSALSKEGQAAVDSFISRVGAQLGDKAKPVVEALSKAAEPNVILDQTAFDAIKGVWKTFSQFGQDLSAASSRKARQIFDMGKDFTAPAKTAVDEADRAAANAIRTELGKARPDLAKLNAEFHFWSSFKEVVDATKLRKVSHGKGLVRSIGAITGAALGVEQQKGKGIVAGLEGATLGAVLGERAIGFIGSPAFKSLSSIQVNKFANLLAKGDLEGAKLLLSKLMAGVGDIISPPAKSSKKK